MTGNAASYGETAPGLGFEVLATDGDARRGQLATAHGEVQTPAFMPVGTAATVKAMTPEAVAQTGAQIVLGNTYHLMLRPGSERIRRLGGLRRFMHWDGPVLTDSGGFQVMSLADLRQVAEEGVTFRSHLDGSRHLLSPESAMQIQDDLDSTITMQLDECVAYPAPEAEAERAMELSLRWARRCRAAFRERPGYGLFGIVQGGVNPTLRHRSASGLVETGFDGYALGGLAVGEGLELRNLVLEATLPHLPADRPRYLMGVGKPVDLVESVARGVDMFDCVLPTRSGRTSQAFTRDGPLNLRNARFADDPEPLDAACACPACSHYGRAYLHHLVKAKEILGSMLLTWHNLTYYQDLMRGMREAIAAGRFAAFRSTFLASPAAGEAAGEAAQAEN